MSERIFVKVSPRGFCNETVIQEFSLPRLAKKYCDRNNNNTLVHRGRELHQIVALRDFNDVKKGDLGGWIEKKENLSHYGNCWVYNGGKVFDNGNVCGNGKVYDRGQVFNQGEVLDEGQVYNDGQVYSNGCVYGRGKVYGFGQVGGNVGKVYDDGKVYGHGKVYGQGRVRGFGEVYDHGVVYDDGEVYDNGKVCNDGKVCGRTKICGDSIVSFYNLNPHHCIIESREKGIESYKDKEGWDDNIIDALTDAIKVYEEAGETQWIELRQREMMQVYKAFDDRGLLIDDITGIFTIGNLTLHFCFDYNDEWATNLDNFLLSGFTVKTAIDGNSSSYYGVSILQLRKIKRILIDTIL